MGANTPCVALPPLKVSSDGQRCTVRYDDGDFEVGVLPKYMKPIAAGGA